MSNKRLDLFESILQNQIDLEDILAKAEAERKLNSLGLGINNPKLA